MKKILLLGPEVTDFLNPLAKKFVELGYTVDLLENRKTHRINETISSIYSNVYNYQEMSSKKIRVIEIIINIFRKSFIDDFFSELFNSYLEGRSEIIKSFKRAARIQHLRKIFGPVLNKYDIINFHSISPGMFPFISAVKPDKKIILSFWGSDLFQINGIKNYTSQLKSIRKADIITVQSYEMELTVLAKFGSELKDKIVRALFGINDSVFDRLDTIKNAGIDLSFFKQYSMPQNKLRVTICYCGNPICNHLPILDELEKLDKETKDKIHLMVPMTYGNFTKDYLEEIKQKLDYIKITYTLLENFLPYDDVLKMRVHSDIMIMMNKSDALSQSVSEFLYAENLLISAAWLPYSPFRLAKIFMYESDFPELSKTLTHAVKNFESLQSKLERNPEKIKNFTAFSNIWKSWSDLLEALNKS